MPCVEIPGSPFPVIISAAPSAANSTFTISQPRARGTPIIITVTVKDGSGNRIPTGGHAITVSVDGQNGTSNPIALGVQGLVTADWDESYVPYPINGATHGGINPASFLSLLDNAVSKGIQFFPACASRQTQTTNQTGRGPYDHARHLARIHSFIDTIPDSAIAPYVTSADEPGLFGIYVIDEPACKICWMDQRPTQRQVEEAAALWKKGWPSVHRRAMRIGANGNDIGDDSTANWIQQLDWNAMTHIWGQYSNRFGDPAAYAAANVELANLMQMRLILGANIEHGGTPNDDKMTAQEMYDCMSVFANTPKAEYLTMWQLNSIPEIFGQANFITKLGDVRDIAAGRTGTIQTLTVTDNEDGTYTATYIPNNVGDDDITVKLGGTNLSGSPATITILATEPAAGSGAGANQP